MRYALQSADSITIERKTGGNIVSYAILTVTPFENKRSRQFHQRIHQPLAVIIKKIPV